MGKIIRQKGKKGGRGFFFFYNILDYVFWIWNHINVLVIQKFKMNKVKPDCLTGHDLFFLHTAVLSVGKFIIVATLCSWSLRVDQWWNWALLSQASLMFPTTERDVGCWDTATSSQGNKNKKSREHKTVSVWWFWVLQREKGTKKVLPNDMYRSF